MGTGSDGMDRDREGTVGTDQGKSDFSQWFRELISRRQNLCQRSQAVRSTSEIVRISRSECQTA